MEEMKAAKAIHKCTKSISNTSLEQAAYYRGLSAIKGFDLAKYKKDVKQELDDEEDDDDSDGEVPGKVPKKVQKK